MKKTIRPSRVIVTILCFMLSLIWWIPVIWPIIVAFKPYGSPVYDLTKLLSIPNTLDNFDYVLNSSRSQANMPMWMFNSFFIAIISTVGICILSICAAYSFSKFKYPGRGILFWIVMAGMMIPQQAMMIPLYLMSRSLKLLNTYWCLILPSLGSSFAVLMLKQFMDGLPMDLFEAANLDGCNSAQTLLHVVMPLTKPALFSIGIFIFLQRWNDFMWPFIAITKPELMTVAVGITFFKANTSDAMSYFMAANTLVMIPLLLIFFLCQKQLVEGIAFTGIKA